jgi:hypothetical protein
VDRHRSDVEATFSVRAQEVGVVREADRELAGLGHRGRCADRARGLHGGRVHAAVDHAPRRVVARARLDVAGDLRARKRVDDEAGALDERARRVE